ncbi:hypothetical protein, partial [Fibrobacter sp.]|uniref:hypothetical protein n=1 Tax=Fibrobacter sp. TaxID=35828 RepID=UPI0025C62C62
MHAVLVQHGVAHLVGLCLVDAQAEISLALALAPFLLWYQSQQRAQLAAVGLLAWQLPWCEYVLWH